MAEIHECVLLLASNNEAERVAFCQFLGSVKQQMKCGLTFPQAVEAFVQDRQDTVSQAMHQYLHALRVGCDDAQAFDLALEVYRSLEMEKLRSVVCGCRNSHEQLIEEIGQLLEKTGQSGRKKSINR